MILLKENLRWLLFEQCRLRNLACTRAGFRSVAFIDHNVWDAMQMKVRHLMVCGRSDRAILLYAYPVVLTTNFAKAIVRVGGRLAVPALNFMSWCSSMINTYVCVWFLFSVFMLWCQWLENWEFRFVLKSYSTLSKRHRLFNITLLFLYYYYRL